MAGRWDNYRTDGELFLPGATQHQPRLSVQATGVEERVDLRDKCSPVEDQSTLGSCASCGIVGALEFDRRKKGNTKDLSVLFLYYNARRMTGHQTTDSGSLITHALGAALTYGVCEDAAWPYDVSKMAQEPPKACYDGAYSNTPGQFAAVGSADEVMAVLSKGAPVVLSTTFGGPEINSAAATGKMPVFRERLSQGQGHTMLIVGYDKAQQLWLVRNSWGAQYGEKGYLWIPFENTVMYSPYADFHWVIGSMIQFDKTFTISGPQAQRAAMDLKAAAPGQMSDALEHRRRVQADAGSGSSSTYDETAWKGASDKRQDFRKEQQDHLDDSKKSIRDRLRAQENQLGQRRNQDGGDQNNN